MTTTTFVSRRPARRPVLILDLDHTLVHSISINPIEEKRAIETSNLMPSSFICFSLKMKNHQEIYLVKKRCQSIRNALKLWAYRFDIYVVTQGRQSYAEKIVDFLDPDASCLDKEKRMLACPDDAETVPGKSLQTCRQYFKFEAGASVLIIDDNVDAWHVDDHKHVFQINAFVDLTSLYPSKMARISDYQFTQNKDQQAMHRALYSMWNRYYCKEVNWLYECSKNDGLQDPSCNCDCLIDYTSTKVNVHVDFDVNKAYYKFQGLVHCEFAGRSSACALTELLNQWTMVQILIYCPHNTLHRLLLPFDAFAYCVLHYNPLPQAG